MICGLSSGADAGIGTTYNIMLPEYKKLYDSFCKGDMKSAYEMQTKVNRVTNVMLKREVIPALKYLLTTIGFDVGNATYPLHRFQDEEKTLLLDEIKRVGWPFKG